MHKVINVLTFLFCSQALLAGSDHIKFGYVSRAMVRDSSRHVILGTQQYKPSEVAAQINLSMDNAWGILRCIVDICMKQKDGQYYMSLVFLRPSFTRLFKYPILNNLHRHTLLTFCRCQTPATITHIVVN